MSRVLFILIFWMILSSFYHPMHISVTTIDYNEDLEEFTILFKLFKDDFEKIVNHKYNTDLDIVNCSFIDKDSLYLEKYINENFSMKFDGKTTLKKQELHNTRCDDEAIWIDFKMKKTEPKKTIEITNTLMTDLYYDQKNLVIIKYKEFEKGVQFNIKKRFETFTL